MGANTFGKLFAVTTFGESHGPAIGCVVDGCPPGIALSPADFVRDLARRATGKSRHTSQRHEEDAVESLSGLYEGRSTGTPIALLVRNTDAKSKDYDKIAEQFRPGHADYTYWQKYGIRDPRGGGRSSARETTMRVAAAVIARSGCCRSSASACAALSRRSRTCVRAPSTGRGRGQSLLLARRRAGAELEAFMDALRKSGDSVGARVDVVAEGVPPGWGEPVYGKLDAEIASAMMGINAVKGVEIGAGFASVAQKGSEHRDADAPGRLRQQPRRRHPRRHLHRPAGDRFGRLQAHLQPAPAGREHRPGRQGGRDRRHRPPRSLRRPARHAICEAMLALVLMDQALRHRAQCGDVGSVHPRIPT
jgi:chorismate synthase